MEYCRSFPTDYSAALHITPPEYKFAPPSPLLSPPASIIVAIKLSPSASAYATALAAFKRKALRSATVTTAATANTSTSTARSLAVTCSSHSCPQLSRRTSLASITLQQQQPELQTNHSFSNCSRRFFSATTANMSDTHVHSLDSWEAYTEALAKPGVMIIDCYAEWCGPCKVVAPKVADMAKEYPQARFYKVDVDNVPDVAKELNIRAMPTFKVFKNGEIFETVVGANAPALENQVKSALV